MRKLFALGALALFAGFALPAVASAGNDVARGHAVVFPTFAGLESVDFNAQSNYNGTGAGGSAAFTDRDTDPNTKLSGNVTCLFVFGDQAVISGDVTQIHGGDPFLASLRSFIIRAADNGKPGEGLDTLGYTFLTSPAPPAPTCGSAIFSFMAPIFEGEIEIQDAIN